MWARRPWYGSKVSVRSDGTLPTTTTSSTEPPRRDGCTARTRFFVGCRAGTFDRSDVTPGVEVLRRQVTAEGGVEATRTLVGTRS